MRYWKYYCEYVEEKTKGKPWVLVDEKPFGKTKIGNHANNPN